MPARDDLHLVLYELAMSIGDSLDLRQMLRNALSTYLRKLNCSAVGVITHTADDNDGHRLELLQTIPRSFGVSEIFATIAKGFPDPNDEAGWLAFRRTLPIQGRALDAFYHVMPLADWGLLLLVSKNAFLDLRIIKSLAPVNSKLAHCQRKLPAPPGIACQ